MEYIPKEKHIMDYLLTHKGVSFISVYSNPTQLYSDSDVIKIGILRV